MVAAMLQLQLLLAATLAISAAAFTPDRAIDNLHQDLEKFLSGQAPANLEKEERNCRNLASDEASLTPCDDDSNCASGGEKGCIMRCFSQQKVTWSPLHNQLLPAQVEADGSISKSLPFNGTASCSDEKTPTEYCKTVAKMMEAQSKQKGVCLWIERDHLLDFKATANDLKKYHKKLQKIKAGALSDDPSHKELGQALNLEPKSSTDAFKKKYGDKAFKMYLGKPLGANNTKDKKVIELFASPAPKIDPDSDSYTLAPTTAEGWLAKVEDVGEAVVGDVGSWLGGILSLEKKAKELEK